MSAVAITLQSTRKSKEPISQPQASTTTSARSTAQDQSREASSSNISLPRVTHLVSNAHPQAETQPNQPQAKRRKVNPSKELATAVTVSSNEVSTNTAITAPVSIPQQGTTVHSDNVEGAAIEPVMPKTKRRATKARGKKRMEEAAAAIVADAVGGITSTEGGTNPERKTRSRKGRRRAVTPDDAETVEITPTVVKMADLCRDNRTGKMSEKGKQLQEWEAAEVARKEKEKEQSAENDGEAQQEIDTEHQPQLSPQRAVSTHQHNGLAALAPVMRVVNGRIVEADPTRQIDLRANTNIAAEEGEVVNQFAHRINSGTYMRRRTKRSRWDEESTDRFYDGLRMFGTDFGMISKMFPGRSRREIKLKFTKEEKLESEKIKETLLGERLPVDMDDFSKMTNTVYRDPSELERDMAEDRKRIEEEQAKEKEAMDEATRKRAEVAEQEAAVDHDSSAKENEAQEKGPPVEETMQKGRKGGKRAAPNEGKQAPRTRTRNTRGTKSRATPLVQSTA